MPSQEKRWKEVMICQKVMEQAPRATARYQEAVRVQVILPRDLAGKKVKGQGKVPVKAKAQANEPAAMPAVVKVRAGVVVKRDVTGDKQQVALR